MIKPDWSIKLNAKKEPNPKFIREIPNMPKTIEGCLSETDVKELNALGYNAYWFPNHPSKDVYSVDNVRHLSGKMIDKFQYVFVDMDSKDGNYTVDEFLEVLKNFPAKPTQTVKSGHGVHAYWKMNNLTREEYIFTQFALLRHFNTDPSVWTVLQLMRVPGSLNTKEESNYKLAEIVEELSSGNASYDNISCFPPEIFNLTEEDRNKAQNHLNKLTGVASVGLEHSVDMDVLPDSFIKLMAEDAQVKGLFEDPVGTYGDRSGADMKLTNILFRKKFPKKEAMAIIANSQKALSKGAYRSDYVQATLDKAYVDRVPNKFMTVSQKLKMGHQERSIKPVRGPEIFDCLVKRWQKKQVLGLVAGSGVGKTTVVMQIIESMIENNYNENDDIYVFFSLEMPEHEIIERWVNLVGEDSKLADRLYVIGNEDDNDNPRNIGLQEIWEYCSDLKTQTGRDIGCITIDHIGIMSLRIDTKKEQTFGIESEQNSGYGDVRTLSLNSACTQLKTLSKMLDTFVIPLTQTTKEKGKGYTPLGKDAAYGISQYENIVDYMITLWQPLQLIQEQTELRMLAWQYAKIRHQSKDDPIKINSYKLLTYNMDTGNLTIPSVEEYQRFSELLPVAQEQAKLKEKKIEVNYTRSINLSEMQDLHSKLRQV